MCHSKLHQIRAASAVCECHYSMIETVVVRQRQRRRLHYRCQLFAYPGRRVRPLWLLLALRECTVSSPQAPDQQELVLKDRTSRSGQPLSCSEKSPITKSRMAPRLTISLRHDTWPEGYGFHTHADIPRSRMTTLTPPAEGLAATTTARIPPRALDLVGNAYLHYTKLIYVHGRRQLSTTTSKQPTQAHTVKRTENNDTRL